MNPNAKINPCAFPTDPERCNDGMTLRDWFAGQALMGLVQFAADPHRLNCKEQANAAYNLADAMLAERAKGGA